jgi:hypothetical protein
MIRTNSKTKRRIVHFLMEMKPGNVTGLFYPGGYPVFEDDCCLVKR